MVCVCGFYGRCVGVWMVWAYGYMYSFGCVGGMGAWVYVFWWVGGVGAWVWIVWVRKRTLERSLVYVYVYGVVWVY